MSSKALSQMKIQEKGIIENVVGDGSLQTRLKELGLVPGTAVSIKRFAPFGDPIELEVRGYRLSIRRADASHILIRPANGI